MKKLLLALVVSFISINVFAQHQPCDREITTSKVFLKTVYNYCDVELLPDQLIKVLATDPSLDDLANSMRINFAVGSLFKAVGGVMIAYPLYDLIAGNEDVNYTLGGIGLGLYVVSIPFTLKFKSKANEAIGRWNNSLVSANEKAIDFKLALAPGGVGLRVDF